MPIQLRDVSVTFSQSILQPTTMATNRARLSGSGATHSQVDSAFTDRAIAQATRNYEGAPGGTGVVSALDHLNLVIPDGQTLTIVGPSGCGKSTLLRVVAGLVSNYSGQVLYDDRLMRDVPPKDRFIGMVFQNYALYPHFKGRGNLAFTFLVRNRPDEEAEDRIRVTSEMMGIGFSELLKRKPGKLSGGQQQRVAIARAIVRNPRLFLFDEPLSNLDAKLRSQTRVEIKRLLHRFRITSVYVTHDQVEAVVLGDQIAVMRAGKIEQVGAYQELRQDPVNAFVAGFLGSPPMNLISGGTVDGDVLCIGQIAIPLSDRARARVHAGQRLTLGVRPQALRLRDGNPPPEGSIHLRGTVEVVQPDFSRRTQLVYVRTGLASYAATGTLDMTLNVGDQVAVDFPRDQLYFFDDETEERVG